MRQQESDEAFLKRLLATFKAEAAEHVRALSACLIEIERASQAQSRQRLIETIFRETHSLKGAARAVGMGHIEALCRSGEEVFAALKKGRIELSPALLDHLHTTVGVLERYLLALESGPAPADLAAAQQIQNLLTLAARGALPATVGAGAQPDAGVHLEPDRPGPLETPYPRPDKAGTVRVRVARLDAVLFQSEALLSAKLTAQQHAHDLREARWLFAAQHRHRAKLAPDIRRLQRALGGNGTRARYMGDAALQLRRLLDYLGAEESFFKSFESRLAGAVEAAGKGERSLGSQVDALLGTVKRVLMLPMVSITEGLPKLVRDLSREQGKEVEFTTSGEEIEIDRRILEEMRDPLIHLVRNCIDHGIETPEPRERAGKARRGRIALSASQVRAGQIEIRIADDGAGINVESLRAAARKLGLPDEDGERLLSLVFQSGVSTSPLVTDISGRGLGLAIVRDKVERLGGSIAVESRPGAGTMFRLVLPLSLATFRGVRVRAAGEEFIFPTMALERVIRLARADIVTMEHREVIRLEEQAVAVARLAEVMELPGAQADLPAVVPAVVAGTGERRIAFLVEEVIGEQEVLAKGLGRQLRRVRNIAGATVLGTGKVVPILYVPDLFKSARRCGRVAPKQAGAQPVMKSLLVAEDSITSRTLLKGLLESAGYRVETAADGMDAYARLRSGAFDLLVSDIDMPRMSGLDLTARVRADKQLADLPVVLVTALDSREDRERGAEAGANAYIVKSSFDQSNLLSVIRGLL